jgi:hypothetical protein
MYYFGDMSDDEISELAAECDDIVFGVTPVETIEKCNALAEARSEGSDDEIDLSGAYDVELSEGIEAIPEGGGEYRERNIGDELKKTKRTIEQNTRFEVQSDTTKYKGGANPFDRKAYVGLENENVAFQVYGKVHDDDLKGAVGMGGGGKSKSQVGAGLTLPIPGT